MRSHSRARWSMAAGLLIFLGASAGGAHAFTLYHTYSFEPSHLEIVEAGPAKSVRVAGLASTWDLGQPALPYDIVTLLVPQGSRAVALRVRSQGEAVLESGILLQPAAPIVNDEGKLLQPKPMRPASQVQAAIDLGPGLATSYPAMRAELAGGGALHGYQMISVRVYPVRYEPDGGRLLATRSLDLELELESGGALPLQRQRYSASIEADARRTLARFVANRDAIDSYPRRIGLRVERPEGGFQPTDAPSLEGSDVDYVIITTDALAATWQVLADWKTRRGVPTVVRTVEWINANYRRGSDVQETIRTFIKDAYAKWAVAYVLLAGDTDLLPARYGYSAFSETSESKIPSDMYFACLDGNWNRDGDNVWGEAAFNASTPVDSTDMFAEVYVGRVPASTVARANNFITKLTTYENPAQTAYQNKLLLLGEVLFPVDWQPGQAAFTDGANFCDELSAVTTACASKTRLYQNNTAYPGSQPLSRQATINEMNAGYGFVNHIGHGYRYSMSLADLSLVNANVLTLTNGDKRFVLYMLNCTATAFDFPCLAEAFLLDTTGGAVAVLGASRAAYPQPSRNYNLGFFNALHQQGVIHIGRTFVQSRLAFTPNAWFDTGDHYSHLLYNFLGDPEMIVHTCSLGATAASYPSSIGLGLTNVNLTITVGGSPVEDALVCLQKGTEEYEFGTTSSAGTVTLAFRAETTGSVQVTVSGQNMTTHLGTINVTAGSVAYVRNTSLTLDDNSSGSSNGNSDLVLDAGETIELSASFNNSGTISAGSVSGKLRIPSPWATVGDSTFTLGTIGAGGNASQTNQVRFSVPASAPDGTVLPLTWVTTNGTTTWTDVVNKVVHAPKMQLTLLDVDDFAPGGNNDGVIQAGETFDLLAYYKNYGTGAADALTATLATSDPDVTIFTGAVSVGRANSMQELTGATRFRVRETALQENTLTLSLTDNRARTLVLPITLRGPAAPAAPVLDASTGSNIVLASWTPNLETDLAGYNLYRATNPNGPWTRTTLDRTARVAYFRDPGLAPSTRYYYRVTAVDTSGNESAPSTSSSINTNPAQLNGWPISLGASSSCPVAVGDITNDGSKEIVAGNDHLYAWNWNGNELRDDDANPQTWGVFANEIPTITGAVALAQLDNTHGYEVFATTWDDSNRAWVVRGDGSIMPGWPRMPDPTSVQRGYWASAAAMDVNADGRAELFASAKNGNLYAWYANGTPLGSSEAFKTGLGTYSRCSPTFANVDGDPWAEIVFGAPNGQLYIWNSDGSNVSPFPTVAGSLCYSNTAIGDIDKDGTLDVVMITEGGRVNVYNTRTGVQLPGWPVSYSLEGTPIQPSPALADFNFDGFLDVVVANNDSTIGQSGVRVYNHLGVLQPGWPKLAGGYSSESSPIIADISGDGIPDILFGNEGGLLYGWDKNGNDIAGFPLSIGDFIRSTPFADDVDGDGGIDLVLAGWDKNVYIWDFPVPYVKAAAQWPTLKHDVQRTGYFGYRPRTPTDAGDPTTSRVPARVVLEQNVPNPFNPITFIAYGVPAAQGASAVEVRLDVFDVQGRLVRRLVRGTQAPGSYKAIWDGRDDHGTPVHSGVYFSRLRVADQVATKKMMMLK